MLLLAALFASAGFAPVPHPVDYRQLQQLTPCQTCCSPGGDCAAAFHGKPGICCGTDASGSACCPASANGVPLAMCVKCNIGYRCATSGTVHTSTDRNRICAENGGAPGGSPSHGGADPQHRSSGGAEDAIKSLVGAERAGGKGAGGGKRGRGLPVRVCAHQPHISLLALVCVRCARASAAGLIFLGNLAFAIYLCCVAVQRQQAMGHQLP